MPTKYLVIDLETSIHNTGDESVGDMKASPFHHKNRIIYSGYKSNSHTDVCIDRIYTTYFTSLIKELDADTILVGHNIAFDLHYLMKDLPYVKEWMREGQIWDTQLAEFIISGQTNSYPSLDDCASKYGGTVKDSKIKEYWNAGISTEDIPEEEITEYLRNDVLNTELVFLNQLQYASNNDLLNLIRTQMDARLATIEMEHNGMYVDRGAINSGIEWLKTKIQVVEHEIYYTYLPYYTKHAPKLNINSDEHLSAVLFGGTITLKEKEPILDENGNPVLYKSGLKVGQPKYKNVDNKYSFSPIFVPNPAYKLKKEGFYSTAEDVLRSLTPLPLIDSILTYRTLKKDLSTYFEGYKKLLWPTPYPHLGVIHQSLNHCVAVTGRLSCTKPNLQNVTSED